MATFGAPSSRRYFGMRFLEQQSPHFKGHYLPYGELKWHIRDIAAQSRGQNDKISILRLPGTSPNSFDLKTGNNSDDTLERWHETLQQRLRHVELCIRMSVQDLKHHFDGISQMSPNRSDSLDLHVMEELQRIHTALLELRQFAILNEAALYSLMERYDEALQLCTGCDDLFPKYAQLAGVADLSLLNSLDHDVKCALAECATNHRARGHTSGLSLEAAQMVEGVAEPDQEFHVKLTGENMLWFFLGSSFALLGSIIILQILPAENQTYSVAEYLTSLSAFRLGLYVVLVSWCMAVVVNVFEESHINYKVILGIDPHCRAGPTFLFSSSALITSMWIGIFGVYTVDYKWFQYCHRKVLPVLSIGVIFSVATLPSDKFRYEDRLAILGGMSRTFLAPFFPVSFGDNIIGDVLTSLVKPLQDIPSSLCFFIMPENVQDFQASGDVCPDWEHAWVPVTIGAAPFVFRLLQCLRRFVDTRESKHMLNFGKYAASLLVVIITYKRLVSLTAMCVISFVSSMYSFAWDVSMDWGLSFSFLMSRTRTDVEGALRAPLIDSAKHERVFTISVYRIAVIVDFVFRLAWILSLFPVAFLSDSILNRTILQTIIPLAEILRRGLWVVLRVENEMSTNADGQRSILWIPTALPVQTRRAQPSFF